MSPSNGARNVPLSSPLTSAGATPTAWRRRSLHLLLSMMTVVFAGYGCGTSADRSDEEPLTTSTQSELEGLTCAPGSSVCSGACADLHVDPNNCGACGNRCAAGQTCSSGLCQGPIASVPDAVVMDPSIGRTSITYSSLSNPVQTSFPVVFTPIPCAWGTCTTRDAFTKDQPLALPCDVDFLSVGVAFKNVSAQSLYMEWSGALWDMGNEKKPIANAYGQTEIPIADGRLYASGQVGTGGFIFIAQPPLLDFTTSQFPPNVPLRIQMASKGFASPTIDPARGSYALANLVPESVVFNNNFRIWVRRTCP